MGNRGFSLVELMIVGLIISALGLGVSVYMKRSSSQFRGADQTESLRSQVQLVESFLKRELQQIVFVNPSCDLNPPPGASPSISCSNILVRGGYTPYPGETQEQMDTRTNLELSTNLSVSNLSLSFESDAARIALFDYDSSFHCPLDEATPNNPSSANHQMWAAETCPSMEVGKLYVLMEPINGRMFSNVFQITNISGGSGSPFLIETEPGGIFNQTGPLGTSAFSSNARIFPIYFVEYAVSSNGGLFRREIRPSTLDPVGYGDWIETQPSVEGLQFNMLSVTNTQVHTHNRTMSLTGDALNNGVEDIRGVSPRVVIKSDRENPDKLLFDNPLTTLVENDHFPRQETNFYVNFKNANLN